MEKRMEGSLNGFEIEIEIELELELKSEWTGVQGFDA
jgi:hypothetical protein